MVKKLDTHELPSVLENDIDELIRVINSGERIFDLQMGEVLGDINQCESCRLISSSTAKILRDYYINGGMFNE